MQPVNALVPISIALHTYKSSREMAVGLFVIWMGWRLTIFLIEMAGSASRPDSPKFYLALFIGLLLVNARPIALRDDVQGPSQFLLIGLGVIIGALMSPKAWRATLGWLAVSSLPLIGQFVAEALSSGAPLSLASIETIYNATMRGHGGISRFGTLALLLTMSAWYFTFLSRAFFLRSLALGSLISAYILCLGSGSRIAAYGAPLAAILAWTSLRLFGRHTSKLLEYLLASGAALLSLLMWWFLFSPEAAINRLSDFFRFEAAKCWLSIMFSGHNRFIWGVGYGNETSNRICHHIPDYRGELGTIGHAHNTIAHIAGQHGMLGLIALLILLLVIVGGLRNQFRSLHASLPLPPRPPSIPWLEVSLGLNLALFFNFLATTIHISNQINQVLIGMLAASALHISHSSETISATEESHQPTAGGNPG